MIARRGTLRITPARRGSGRRGVSQAHERYLAGRWGGFSSRLTQVVLGSKLVHMEVHFTAEQEALLSRIATQKGVVTEELVKDAALRLLADDARFRAGVRKGIEQADRGEFIEEGEMDARVKRMFQP